MTAPRAAAAASTACRALVTVAEVVAAAALVCLLCITFANTMMRYLFNGGIDWAEDVSTICVAALTFLGAAAYLGRGGGLAYTAVVDQVPGLPGAALRALGQWGVLTVCLACLWAFPEFLALQRTQTLPVLEIDGGAVALWMGAGLALMALFTLEALARQGWRAALLGAVPVGIIGALLLLLGRYWPDSVDPMIPAGIVMAIAFAAGTPVPYILALAGLAFLMITGQPGLVGAPAALQAGTGSFILVAIPFFLLAGLLMEVTGMAARLVDSVQAWLGHIRGGLLLAQVAAMYVFSGMSGSKAADVATVGSIMKGPLRQHGYPPTESVAVLAAAAAMGEVIPPSLALLVLGSITTLSVGTLFVAGILPAAMLAIVLVAAILWRARSGGLPKGPPFRLRHALGTLPRTIPALMVPVVVIGSIVGGIASPTEASSFAVVYAVAAAFVFYRPVDIAGLWPVLRDATLTAGMLLFMVGASNLVSQAVVIDGLAATLSAAAAATGSATVFLFASMAAVIVLGFILEGFPAILISAPILLPIAVSLGIDPLQYGILLVMAVGIGVFMPPVGIGYYVACAVGGAPPHETMRASALYNVFLIIGLVIAMFVPSITLAVPSLFGLH